MLLRTLAVCLLVTQCSGASLSASADVPDPIADLIIALLEQFRASLTEPQPLGDIAMDLDSPGTITIHLNITDALLHDLSTFVIDDVSVNALSLKADIALSLPTLSLDCNYAFGSGSVIADLFPFYGSGPCSVGLGGILLSADADLRHNRSDGHDHYQIDTLDFNFHFDTLDVQIHNLFNNEDLATVIDEFADDFGPVLVDVLVNETKRDLMPLIIDELNTLLWNASILLVDAPDHVPISEPLKPMPVKFNSPIQDSLVGNGQIFHHQNFARMNNVDQAYMPYFNAKKRQGNHP